MGYREYAPPPALAPWLACIWERRSLGGPPVRVLPDGCIDVVWTEGAGTRIVGANTTAFLIGYAAPTRIIGARLRPGCAPSLLGIGAEEVRDASVPLEELWGAAGERLAAGLDQAQDPVSMLRTALLDRARRAERPDPLVCEAVTWLARPRIAVAGLAEELNISERQLRRRVSAAVGYGPRRLGRVLRLGRALDRARDDGDLAAAAFDAGYADQAHFANDCRVLAGVSPSVLVAN